MRLELVDQALAGIPRQKCLKTLANAGVSVLFNPFDIVPELHALAADQDSCCALEYNHCMIFSRYIRKLAAVTAVLGLLFAQFTVAAYACPFEPNAMAAHHVAVESSGPSCHQGKDMQGNLCEAHCQDGQKNVPAAHTPPAVDFVAAFIVTLPVQQPAQQIADAIAINNTTPHHSPPIILRNACFRI